MRLGLALRGNLLSHPRRSCEHRKRHHQSSRCSRHLFRCKSPRFFCTCRAWQIRCSLRRWTLLSQATTLDYRAEDRLPPTKNPHRIGQIRAECSPSATLLMSALVIVQGLSSRALRLDRCRRSNTTKKDRDIRKERNEAT